MQKEAGPWQKAAVSILSRTQFLGVGTENIAKIQARCIEKKKSQRMDMNISVIKDHSLGFLTFSDIWGHHRLTKHWPAQQPPVGERCSPPYMGDRRWERTGIGGGSLMEPGRWHWGVWSPDQPEMRTEKPENFSFIFWRQNQGFSEARLASQGL